MSALSAPVKGEILARCIGYHFLQDQPHYLLTRPFDHDGRPSKWWFVLGGYLNMRQEHPSYLPGTWGKVIPAMKTYISKRMDPRLQEVRFLSDFTFFRKSDEVRVYVANFVGEITNEFVQYDYKEYADIRLVRAGLLRGYNLPEMLRREICNWNEDLLATQAGKRKVRQTTN